MTGATAKSSQLMRQLNSSAVVRFALRSGEFTATDVIEATNLTRATVLSVCSALIKAGWLEKSSDTRVAGLTSRGRPASRYRLRQGSSVVVGLDAGEHRLTVTVADLRGNTIASGRRRIASRRVGVTGRVDAARALISETLESVGRTSKDTLLTVVGVPAPVDAEGRSPAGEGTFWPLMNAGLKDALDGTVMLENDANLAAIAERSHDESYSANTATLLTGERFGAGVIVDGELLRGARGGVGEMRMLDVIFEGDPNATDGIGALARKWARREIISDETSSSLSRMNPKSIRAEDVFRAASEGDAFAESILERLGARLSRVVVVLFSLFDIERIVVAGALADALEPVLKHTRRTLEEKFYPPIPDLVASRLGRDVVVKGAVESALNTIRRRPLDFTKPSVSSA